MSANARLLADGAMTPGTQRDWASRSSLAAAAQQQRSGALVGQQSWVTATLINGWANYGSGFNPAGYYKDPVGRIWLRGLLSGAAATVDTIAFTLPWVPAYRQLLGTIAYTGGTYAPGRLDVDTSGNVIPVNSGAGTSAWISLDGLSFLLS